MGLLEDIKDCTYDGFFERTAVDRRCDLPRDRLYSYAEVYEVWQELRTKSDFHRGVVVVGLNESKLELQPEKLVVEKIQNAIMPVDGFVAAGGFLAYACTKNGIMFGKENAPADIDFFPIIGKEEANERLLNFCKSSDFSSAVVSVGTVTFEYPHKLAHQFILREGWKTEGGILSGFDLDASQICCTWVDGSPSVSLTFAGALALVTGTMVLDTSRCSSSFIARLTKYMSRGWKLALPHLKIGEFEVDDVISLRDATLQIRKKIKERLYVAAVDSKSISDLYRSDYEGGDAVDDCWNCTKKEIQEDNFEDPNTFMTRTGYGPWFYQTNYTAVRYCLGLTKNMRWKICKHCSGTGVFDVLVKAALQGTLTVGQFISDKYVSLSLVGMFKTAVLRNTGSGKKVLRLLDVSKDKLERINHAAEIIERMTSTGLIYNANGRGHKYICLGDILREEISELPNRINRAKNTPISSWMECARGPGDQWTMSLNPVQTTDEEWYGDSYSPANTARTICSDRESTEGAHQAAPIEPKRCCMCLLDIVPGHKNTVMLPCGHSMCFVEDTMRGCIGVWKYISSKGTCPECRQKPIVGPEKPTVPVAEMIIRYVNGV